MYPARQDARQGFDADTTSPGPRVCVSVCCRLIRLMRKRSITRARACIRTGARAADSRHAGGTARRAGGHCRRRGTARDLASPVTRLEQHSRTGAHRQADTAQPLDAPCVRARNAAEHPRQNRRQSQGAGVRGNDKPARSDQKVPRHGHGCRSWVPVQLTQRWQHPGAANDVPVGPLRAGTHPAISSTSGMDEHRYGALRPQRQRERRGRSSHLPYSDTGRSADACCAAPALFTDVLRSVLLHFWDSQGTLPRHWRHCHWRQRHLVFYAGRVLEIEGDEAG